MTANPGVPAAPVIAALPRPAWQSAGLRLLLHTIFLVVALGCFFAYLHLRVGDNPRLAMASLIGAGVFGFAPIRDILRLVFRIEGTALHVAHLVGGLGLIALPVAGVARTPMGPFAMMGAAQALMHSQHPRNAQQAAALQHFVAALPQVASFASAKSLSSPSDAERAMHALTDIVSRAQALGQTELNSDPQFRSAFSQVSARFGTGLGLDAVDMVLNRVGATNPQQASQISALRQQMARARQTLASAGTR